jgi:hypothetical protein
MKSSDIPRERLMTDLQALHKMKHPRLIFKLLSHGALDSGSSFEGKLDPTDNL